MTLTLGHVLVGILGSVFILFILAFLALRSSRPLHPVRCVHCFKYLDRDTVVSLSEQTDQWAICSECVGHYWRFSSDDPDTP